MSALDRLLQYGIASPLAEKARAAGLTTTKIRTLAVRDLVEKFRLEAAEAAELKKCVSRQPIDVEIAELLLRSSNHVCCVCKGAKGHGVIIHHIVEYERSQDNSYSNLAVLCPNDHDRAHQKGLTLGLTVDQIKKSKYLWEQRVEVLNAERAAKAINVRSEAVDYVNVMRIEEMCIQRFGSVPTTTISPSLLRAGIIGPDRRFDEKYVREQKSGRKYLFDYINSGETEHYRQLLEKLSEQVDFEDLSEVARRGIRKISALEGRFAFFIGGVSSKRPKLPIAGSEPFEWRYKARSVEITWNGDAKYLISMSAIGRQGSVNRYVIYCLVRTVVKIQDAIQVKCSPLFVAQPTAFVERKPAVAWQRLEARYLGPAPADSENER